MCQNKKKYRGEWPGSPSELCLTTQHLLGGGGGVYTPPTANQHTNHWAPRTRKRHQQEHRPQRPTESSDPTQHAKGRTGEQQPDGMSHRTARTRISWWEKMKFTNGNIDLDYFWCAKFWIFGFQTPPSLGSTLLTTHPLQPLPVGVRRHLHISPQKNGKPAQALRSLHELQALRSTAWGPGAQAPGDGDGGHRRLLWGTVQRAGGWGGG